MLKKHIAEDMKTKALRTVPKTWGITYTLYAESTFRINLIILKPQAEIASHYHEQRNETWVVAEGTAEIHCDDYVNKLKPGNALFIPIGIEHRIRNSSSKNHLVVVEIQNGNTFGKDDIHSPTHEKIFHSDFNDELIEKRKKMEQDSRDWGGYKVIYDGIHFKIKVLKLLPNARISKQSHDYRQETWTVVKGVGLAELDEQNKILPLGHSIFIPVKAKHRLKNPSQTSEPLEIVEVQTSPHGKVYNFSEKDIHRYEDDYGREVEEEKKK